MNDMNDNTSGGGMNGMNNGTTMPPSSSPMPGMTPMMIPASSPMPHMGSMHGYFFAQPGFYYLFSSWFVETNSALIGATFGSVAFAAILMVLGRYLKKIAKSSNDATIFQDFVASVACGFDMFFHYTLMLLAMTFNIYILIAISVGLGIGHWINLILAKRERAAQQEENRMKLSAKSTDKMASPPISEEPEEGGDVEVLGCQH